MNPEFSDSRPIVDELNQLFTEGADRGLWEAGNQTDFARKIQIDRRKVSSLLRGEQSDVHVQPVVEKVRALLRQTTPISDQAEKQTTTEFDQLFQEGMRQKKWNSMEECAKVLDITRATVRKFRDERPHTFGARTRSFYKSLMTKMKRVLATRHDGGKTSGQAAIVPHPEKAGDHVDLASLIAQPTIERINRLEEKITTMLRSALVPKATQSESAPDGVIPSAWADETVAGRLELVEQKLPGVRFVVTVQTIRRLLAKYRSEEIADTQELAGVIADATAELRRRLTLIPQQQESVDHADAIGALVPFLSKVVRELVALAVVMEGVRAFHTEDGLIMAAKHFETLDIFSNTPQT